MSSSASSISKQTIPEIKINGSNEIFGGKIYYFNTKFNFSEAPNEVQINVVNAEGSYSPPTLDFKIAYTIELGGGGGGNTTQGGGGGGGGMKLGDFYPVKYKTRTSSNGSILEVTFIDETFVLDRVYIGLNSKHG